MKTDIDDSFDIIIVGAGAIGISCALSLATSGLKILILEGAKRETLISLDFDGRNIALNTASVRMFKNLDLWSEIQKEAQPIKDIIVSDGDIINGASSCYLHFDHQHIGNEPFGYFVLNPIIKKVLLDKIGNYKNIHYQDTSKVTAVNNELDYCEITLALGQKIKTKLLIAADGRNSAIREMNNIFITRKEYHRTAIVTMLQHEKSHQGIAQEYFLPNGPFAILPLKGNKSSLVWVEKNDYAKALLNASHDVFAYELSKRFGDFLGTLKVLDQKFSYPLILQRANQIAFNRTILVGDAAHVIHPISGQGFNLGLRDIAYLKDLVEQHSYANLDIGSDILLETYRKYRDNDIKLFGLVTDALNSLFSNDNLILRTSRRVGLSLVNKLPTLRDFFEKTAMNGTISNLPSLMQEL